MLVEGRRGVVGEGASASWAQVVDLLGKAAADAGIDLDGGETAGRRPTRRELLTGSHREQRADRELAEAGIEPGAPQLYEPVHVPAQPDDDSTGHQ